MPELWVPGMEGPAEGFVARLHHEIERFAAEHKIDKAFVEVELRDGSRFPLERVSAEPGYGFITLTPVAMEDVPDELIIPIAAIGRIELSKAADRPERFGFSVPEA